MSLDELRALDVSGVVRMIAAGHTLDHDEEYDVVRALVVAWPGLLGRVEAAEAERDALRAFVEANVDHDHVWENHPTRPIRTLVHSPECRLCAVLAASVPSGPVAAGPTTSKETR